MRSAVWRGHRAQCERVQGIARAAHALSPLQVLSRGYSLTSRTSDHALLRTSADVAVGDRVTTVLERGSLVSQVLSVNDEFPGPGQAAGDAHVPAGGECPRQSE